MILLSSFWRKACLQLLAICIVLPICGYIALPFFENFDWYLVRRAWSEISTLQWGLALVASAGSFAALGRYDVIAHRVLGTGINARAAQLSGAASVALSQFLGFGLITGTLARWRASSSLSLSAAGMVTTLVSFSFLGAWLILFAIVGLSAPTVLPLPSFVFYACLFSPACLILFTALKRYISVAHHRIRLPSLRALTGFILFAALDTGLAAFALWLLMPATLDLQVQQIFLIYLTCLGAALISNTPSGVGAFEVTFLWALQTHEVNELLASLIAFRTVYFALPACCAILYLARPAPEKRRILPKPLLARGLHPETRSGLQTGRVLVTQEDVVIGALARTTQCSALLFNPAAPVLQSIGALRQAAKDSATFPIVYKCSAKTAATLRRSGFAIARIAQDGLIDLKTAELNTPNRRTLRRKLRAAGKANLTIKQLKTPAQYFDRLTAIDADWRAANGTARGVSMGRLCGDYLAAQNVFGAFQGGQLIAYITCHTSPSIWTLDLMRAQAKIPAGTMHALVWYAIETARKSGTVQFSLASTFDVDTTLRKRLKWIPFANLSASNGLAQFKSNFAPRWQPLYAASSTKLSLLIALWDIWREIQDPPPLADQAKGGRG